MSNVSKQQKFIAILGALCLLVISIPDILKVSLEEDKGLH